MMDQEREDRLGRKEAAERAKKKMAKHIGDNLDTCPPEWSKVSALRTAAEMVDRHGAVVAFKKARGFKLSYDPGTWGYKHWTVAEAWIRTKV